MNILFICSARYWGGNEKWTSMAMNELAKDHNIYLCFRKKKLENRFGRKILKFRSTFYSIFDFITYFRIYKFVKSQNIDILLSTKRKEYFIAGILAKILNIKNILRLGIARNMSLPFWHNLVYNKLNHGIIVNAKFIKQKLLRYKFMKSEKIKVIYNGINKPNNIKQDYAFNGNFLIASVGMLTQRKGFHILIKAIAYLPQKLKSKVKLVIIGKGFYKQNLENLVTKYKLKNQITFTGFKEDPSKIVSQSDLFVLLSEKEGISNALIEAMMSGVPVLTALKENTKGVREFITDKKNGYLIQDLNTQNVSNKLAEIIKNRKELENIGKAGQNEVKNKFSIEKMKKELENFLYRRINADI